MLLVQPLGPPVLAPFPGWEPGGRLADACLWIEDVVGTGAPTSLWPKTGSAHCVPVALHQQSDPWLPRWRGGRQNF